MSVVSMLVLDVLNLYDVENLLGGEFECDVDGWFIGLLKELVMELLWLFIWLIFSEEMDIVIVVAYERYVVEGLMVV